MIPEIHRGNLTYWFLAPGQTVPEQASGRSYVERGSYFEEKHLTITSAPEAHAVLRPLASDSVVLHRLRHLANVLGLTKLSNRKDEEVVNYLARQMVTQRLLVVRRLALPVGASADEGRQPGAPRPASASAPTRDRTVEPDPPTFGPDALHDQQAAALIAASADGVPFCEECARRAAEKAA